MTQKIQGAYCFSNITVDYNFTECFSELDIEFTLPLKVKLHVVYFINENKVETKSILLKVNLIKNTYIKFIKIFIEI